MLKLLTNETHIMKYFSIITIIIASLFFIGVSYVSAGDKPQDNRPYIVATTAQIGDILINIVGDDARIESLMGSGVDPHLYRPTRSDVIKLKRADVIFYNGLHLEGQMVGILEKLADEKPTIAIAKNLPESDLLGFDGPGNHDPHIWMDVQKWIHATHIIETTLSGIYPDNAKGIAEKTANYEERLEVLDQYVHQSLSTIPEHKRILVTAHDAFGYLGAAYNIDVIGIQGLSTESEAGLKRMEELVDLLVARKIPAIFKESSVGDRNIKALIEGARAQDHAVKIGDELYSDAMGQAGTYEGTYIGMIMHNIRVITEALGGHTPDVKDKLALLSVPVTE